MQCPQHHRHKPIGTTRAIVAIHLRRDPEPSGRSDRRQTLSPLNENGPPQAPACARDLLFNHARVAVTAAGNPRRRLPGRLLAGDKHGATRRPQALRTADPGWPRCSASHYPSTTEQRDPPVRGRICPRMSDKGVTGSGKPAEPRARGCRFTPKRLGRHLEKPTASSEVSRLSAVRAVTASAAIRSGAGAGASCALVLTDRPVGPIYTLRNGCPRASRRSRLQCVVVSFGDHAGATPLIELRFQVGEVPGARQQPRPYHGSPPLPGESHGGPGTGGVPSGKAVTNCRPTYAVHPVMARAAPVFCASGPTSTCR